MKLYENWKEILTKAWSVRFMLLAAVLSGLEAMMPVIGPVLPTGTFAALSFVATAAAAVARVVAQKNV